MNYRFTHIVMAAFPLLALSCAQKSTLSANPSPSVGVVTNNTTTNPPATATTTTSTTTNAPTSGGSTTASNPPSSSGSCYTFSLSQNDPEHACTQDSRVSDGQLKITGAIAVGSDGVTWKSTGGAVTFSLEALAAVQTIQISVVSAKGVLVDQSVLSASAETTKTLSLTLAAGDVIQIASAPVSANAGCSEDRGVNPIQPPDGNCCPSNGGGNS